MAYQGVQSDSAAKWKRLCELAPDWRGKSVLDLGCAEGEFLVQALKAGASRAIGCEYDAAKAEVASRGVRSVGDQFGVGFTEAHVMHLSAMSPAFLAQILHCGFDTVLCLNVSHWDDGPGPWLALCSQALKRGGFCVFETWVDRNSPGPTMRLLERADLGDYMVIPTVEAVLLMATKKGVRHGPYFSEARAVGPGVDHPRYEMFTLKK